jgi:hypothetical protein
LDINQLRKVSSPLKMTYLALTFNSSFGTSVAIWTICES